MLPMRPVAICASELKSLCLCGPNGANCHWEWACPQSNGVDAPGVPFPQIDVTIPLQGTPPPKIDSYPDAMQKAAQIRLDQQAAQIRLNQQWQDLLVQQSLMPHPDLSWRVPTSPPVSPIEAVTTAKTICIVQHYGSPSMSTTIAGALVKWGVLSVISRPERADLVLEVTETGETSMVTGWNLSIATLLHRTSGVTVWTTPKAGSSRSIAKEFIKFMQAVVERGGNGKH
jgi:hypothetical protein